MSHAVRHLRHEASNQARELNAKNVSKHDEQLNEAMLLTF